MFYDQNTGKAIVAHKGTTSVADWVKTNLPLAFGYERGKRFQHSKKIQKQAEQKYGSKNITTVGHSLGGRLAEKYGKHSDKIVTFNKAATPTSIRKKTKENQTDIRTTRDPVSYLSKYQKGQGKKESIKSKTYNLVGEHSINKL